MNRIVEKKPEIIESSNLTSAGGELAPQNSALTRSSSPATASEPEIEIKYDCMLMPLASRIILVSIPLVLMGTILMRVHTHLHEPGSAWILFPMLLALLPTVLFFRRPTATLKLSARGISFSKIWKAGLLNRLERSWDDVHSIQLVVYSGNKQIFWRGQKIPLRQFLNRAMMPRLAPNVLLEFESGGTAEISLGFLQRQQAEQIFRAIEMWGDTSKFSADIVSLEKSILLEKPQSYTQIWQEDLNERYSGTNYVPLPTNHVLQNGRYRVLMEMTAGGMSAIYLAESDGKKKVVLKEAVAPLDSDEQQLNKSRELFNREAEILAKLNHPQIARVFDHFVERDRDYLVLEYIPGRTLRQVVGSDGKQAEKLVINWTNQICHILTYLHSQEPPVIHRDLTPDNLILREDGTIILVDFGAANEFVGSATGTLIGKQCYMAPEQLRGKATPVSDLYALGATMHFLITGKDPTPLSQSFPATIVPTITPVLNNLVGRLTEFEQSERIASAQAVTEQIKNSTLLPGAK